MVGLLVVLMIGGCAAGMRGCTRLTDPKVWHEQIDEEPVKTRRMLADFLRAATFEPDNVLMVRGTPAKVVVQDYNDDSIHLMLDGNARRLVEVVVRVTDDGGDSRVDVISDASALAEAGHTHAAYLHRDIRSQLERALDAIDRHRPLGGGFSMGRLVRATGGRDA